jgi:hypothetical protein
MTFSKTLMMAALVVLIGSSATIAQPHREARRTESIAKSTNDTIKKAISKACSDQATAKGLHGKECKAFRSKCKRNGGNAA